MRHTLPDNSESTAQKIVAWLLNIHHSLAEKAWENTAMGSILSMYDEGIFGTNSVHGAGNVEAVSLDRRIPPMRHQRGPLVITGTPLHLILLFLLAWRGHIQELQGRGTLAPITIALIIEL